ncbi:transposase-like zinc-binding domain-containing protein [Candidatus Cyrtobacter comes]
MICKHCSSTALVKNVYVQGKQRYECKGCGKTYRECDLREKYSNDKKLKVVCMYLEVVCIMSIERLEEVPNPLIIQ